MHFSLYFPGELTITAEPLARCGVADLARDKSPEMIPLDQGPDGRPGALAIWRTGNASADPPASLSLAQDWQPCRPDPAIGLAAGGYWIGLDKAKPVRPADVERVSPIAGYWVPLGDKQHWHCPAAQHLPHCHGLGDDGRYAREVSSAHRGFWEQSQQFAQQIFATLGQLNCLQALDPKRAPKKMAAEFDLAETFAFACRALAYNYRLNAELITRLGLLADDESLINIVKAAIDLPVLLDVRAQKKTAPRASIPVG